MENGWTERVEELEAENTRLRMLRDAAESRAQGLEAQVAKWKAISPANAMAWQERAENAEAQVAALTAEKDMLRERVGELEVERDADRRREYAQSIGYVRACCGRILLNRRGKTNDLYSS